jgi:hypothetical protein
MEAPTIFTKIQKIMNKFNFDYDGKHYPNYRVEYCTEDDAPSVSSPAIFKNNKEAVAAALEEFPTWKDLGLNVVKVLKYTKQGLKEVFRKVA